MKIVPAILTNELKDLEKKIRQVESFTDIAQIDIMDGKFVPSKSITAKDLSKIKTNLFLEAHLMVDYPSCEIIPFKEAGVKRFIFHFEAKENPEEVIEKIKKENMEVGLAINPETEIEFVEKFFERIELLLIMAVNPGFYGSKFIPQVLEKVRYLKKIRKRKFLIGLDGGIKINNIREIKEAGVELACVGSEIFCKGEPRENFFALLEKIKEI